MPKISIIVPIYNAEKSLSKTINSVQEQTLLDIEIILVNDGSTDNSLSLCKAHAKDDNRIKVINKENEGVSSARNAGMKAATGEYIGFVDAGDWIEPEMYEKMYKKAKMFQADIGMCNYIIHKKGKKTPISINDHCSLITGQDIIYEIIGNMISPFNTKDKQNIMGSVCRLIVNADLIKKHSINFQTEIPLMEDLIFCVEIFLKANAVSINKEFYYHYILESNSASTCYRENMLEIRKKVYEIIEDILIKEKAFNKLKDTMVNRYISIFTGSISNEFRKGNNKNIRQKLKAIEEICRDDKLHRILKEIDTSKYLLKKRIVLNALKYKLWIFLYLYYSIANKINEY